MAYGTLKADTLIYDNSGDQTITVQSLAGKADSASPTFTGTPAAPTAAANTNTTQIATTAYVQTELGDYATLAAPALTGNATGVNLTLSGTLTVNGTTTTINSTTLAVDDKNIELGTVDTPSDTTADGGGITLKGATDKTITWTNATDTWDFNQGIKTTGRLNAQIGQTASPSILVGANMNGSGMNQNTQKQANITCPMYTSDTNTSGFRMIQGWGNDGNNYCYIGGGANNGSTATAPKSATIVKIYTAPNTTADGVEALSIDASQNAQFAGSVTDSKGDLRTIVQVSKSAQHTIVAADSGKHSINSSGGWVLNTSTGFTAGQAITLINNSGGDQTITSTGVTLYNSADGSTPTKIATRGMATVICTASNVYYISGAGLS